jgi:hypothetical protein
MVGVMGHGQGEAADAGDGRASKQGQIGERFDRREGHEVDLPWAREYTRPREVGDTEALGGSDEGAFGGAGQVAILIIVISDKNW